MDIRCYDFDSYKTFLKTLIAESTQRGMVTRLAEAAGCQRSYLSQVLNGNAQLTPDQALGIMSSLGATETETDYFIILVDYERAATPRLRERLVNKLKMLRRKQLKSTARVEGAQTIAESDQQLYYSNWIFGAVHIATSSASYQTLESLSRRFALDTPTVAHVLESLVRMRLVKREGARWLYSGSEIHLPLTSPLIGAHRLNWRVKAVQESIRPMDNDDGVHYSSVFTISLEDAEKLKLQVLKFRDRFRKTCAASPADEVFCFNFDFFRA